MARREIAWPQAVISSICEDLGTTMLGLARFLHLRCILAAMQICPWCLLVRAGVVVVRSPPQKPPTCVRQRPRGPRFPPPFIISHFAVASACRVLLQKGPVFHFNVISHRLGNKYRCCVCNSTVSQVPEESLPLSAFS